MFGPVRLGDLAPLARGGVRLVYQHPDAPDCLIKVMRPDLIAPDGSMLESRWYKRKRRFGPYRTFARDIAEYVAARSTGTFESLPLARVFGFVETDLGFGLVVEKIRGADGGLAPTLMAIVQRGATWNGMLDELDALVADLSARHLIAGDLNLRNIVSTHDAAGRGRFVCVDGLGEKNLIPFRSLLPWLNARKNAEIAARLRRRIAKIEATPAAGATQQVYGARP